jgi:phosphopantetheine adenylyltransferase
LGTERAMELFLAEVVAVLESETEKTCPSCGERLKLVRTMVNPRTGCIVHMFECPCGQRTWVD